jgi:hypothetical protein
MYQAIRDKRTPAGFQTRESAAILPPRLMCAGVRCGSGGNYGWKLRVRMSFVVHRHELFDTRLRVPLR